MTHIVFDGSGHLALAAAWEGSDRDDWRIEWTASLPATGGIYFFSFDSDMEFEIADGANVPHIRFATTGGGSIWRSMGPGMGDLRGDGEFHDFVLTKTGDLYVLTVDGEFWGDHDDSGSTWTAAEYGVLRVGYSFREAAPTAAGYKVARVGLIDPPMPANSSDYLIDEGAGTVVGDSGARDVGGTLVDFVDVESAWVVDESAAPRISFSEGDPDKRLRDRDGNIVTAADVPIRVSTQRDPRGAPALTGAPVTMSITDGAATLDLSAADPMPTTGDAIYVEVFSEQATPEDDISRRYVLRMQDGAEAGG